MLGTAAALQTIPGSDRVLTPDALAFVTDLHRRFHPRRHEILAARSERQARIDRGEMPDFRADTADVRAADWRVAPVPADLDDRRVEITGPAEPKMMINALNSGARVFMADLEDALSPSELTFRTSCRSRRRSSAACSATGRTRRTVPATT